MKNELFFSAIFFAFIGLVSCQDNIAQEPPINNTPQQSETINDLLAGYNDNIAVMQELAAGKTEIVDYMVNEDGSYRVQLSSQKSGDLYVSNADDKDVPVLGIDEKGFWVYALDGEVIPLTDLAGKAAAATGKASQGIMTPQLAMGEDCRWMVSFNGTQWKTLSDVQYPDIDKKSKINFALYKSIALDESAGVLSLVTRVGENGMKVLAGSKDAAAAWKKFAMKADDNVLLDFSYAGYMHGEVAPADGFSLGYKVINIKEEMDRRHKSARETFIEVLKENRMIYIGDFRKANPNAKVVFYFPEGDYVLHNEDDNTKESGSKNTSALDSRGNNTSTSMIIAGGNFVIKGAGRDKTRLIMQTPNLPADPKVMYSSPDLIQIKHNSGLSELTTVTSDAAKGTFGVQVGNPEKVNVGDWVCMQLVNNNPELVAKELAPYKVEPGMKNIIDNGVQIYDYHQVKSKVGNTIYFAEPVMHEVEAKWGWKIMKYNCYENVGVEDLTFVGNCAADFEHHRNWNHDGAYKPLSFTRMVNSWLRRVNFENVSEAMSIYSSANVSAYDVNITGRRGHSAIRSAGSSRVFIGAVRDRTEGPLKESGEMDGQAGQYHACGVSKQSMGAVIWNVTWGLDANFESHATQPRATLIDNCSGGFHQLRQGGAADQVPNHLADLTIWNMNVERQPEIFSASSAPRPANGEYDWWRMGAPWWKILSPTIVGIHGLPVKFVQEQVKLDESNGTKVEPESLYEAQLKHRLGYVPEWLQALK